MIWVSITMATVKAIRASPTQIRAKLKIQFFFLGKK